MQVRFFYEAFRALAIGVPLGALHGNLAPAKRTAVFEAFGRKAGMALLATDVAARGLDFPNVDWVLHLDCPADVHEYIHRCPLRLNRPIDGWLDRSCVGRSGRTARYNKKGEALLVLTPTQQKPFTAHLEQAKGRHFGE